MNKLTILLFLIILNIQAFSQKSKPETLKISAENFYKSKSFKDIIPSIPNGFEIFYIEANCSISGKKHQFVTYSNEINSFYTNLKIKKGDILYLTIKLSNGLKPPESKTKELVVKIQII